MYFSTFFNRKIKLLQLYVSCPCRPSETIKRRRKESKYGEAITFSNRLNELKEKVKNSKSKKESLKSTIQTSSTFRAHADLETPKREKRGL